MDRERWQQIDRIFKAALELPAGKRDSFLDTACKGDAELRREVESLIAHEQGGSFMETPAFDEAAGLLVGDRRSPLAGQSVGPYKILEKIGAGGMGEVYLALHAKTNRKVALKLLPAHFARDEQRAQRFRQEARAVLALNHPNIVTVYDIEQVGGAHVIASEFIEGETLRHRAARTPLSVAEALDVAIQVASALSAAHHAGVVHRDIKPENVMLRPDGYVKVLDFGLAKLTERRGEAAGSDMPTQALVNTHPGMVLGTVNYMSPEQARGLDVDARTDVWSLGILLYEMLTGRLPFTGETATDVLASILQKESPPLARHWTDAPDTLEWIVTKALTKDREGRYQTAKEFQTDLERLKRRMEFEAEAERTSRPSSTNEGPAPRAHAAARGLASDGVAQTHGGGAGTVATSPDTVSSTLAGTLKRRATAATLAGLVIAVALVAAALIYFRGDSRGAAIDSLAVLPLVNDGGDPETEYFSDGITESLINSLSELPSLKVMSRNSVFRYKGRAGAGALEAARQLGVRAVLTGRVAQRGERLLVSVELTDAADNTHVWGRQYERAASDVLAVQREIARDVSERLRLKLSGEQIEKATRSYTDNAEAYRLYLRGRYEWYRFTPDSLDKTIDYFNRAIALDPSYALAYAWLANGYLLRGHAISPIEYYPKAEWAAKKAVEIDPTLADAQAALGVVKLFTQWDWPGAESTLRHAMQLNPNNTEARNLYSIYLTVMGRLEEAKAESLRAQENDPLSPYASAEVAQVYYFAGEYDEAIAHARKGLELGPHLLLYHILARALVQKGLYQEAIAELRKGMEILGRNPPLMASLAHAYAVAGQRAEARKVLDEMEGSARQQYVSPYWLAVAYVGLGDNDRAFELLNRAADDHFFMLIWLAREPRFDSLRSDPRYPALLARIGLPR